MSLGRWQSALRLTAALGCCAAVGLGAYAAHAAEPAAADRLQRASQLLLLHGIAVIALLPWQRIGALPCVAATVLLSGALLFAGSLLSSAALGVAAPLAPIGGLLMMFGWLLVAIAVTRRSNPGTD